MTVLGREIDRITANVFEQAEGRPDLHGFQVGVSYQDVANLEEGKRGGAHPKLSDCHSREWPIGLAIHRKEPLQSDTGINEPAVDGED